MAMNPFIYYIGIQNTSPTFSARAPCIMQNTKEHSKITFFLHACSASPTCPNMNVKMYSNSTQHN